MHNSPQMQQQHVDHAQHKAQPRQQHQQLVKAQHYAVQRSGQLRAIQRDHNKTEGGNEMGQVVSCSAGYRCHGCVQNSLLVKDLYK